MAVRVIWINHPSSFAKLCKTTRVIYPKSPEIAMWFLGESKKYMKKIYQVKNHRFSTDIFVNKVVIYFCNYTNLFKFSLLRNIETKIFCDHHYHMWRVGNDL